MKEEWRKYDPTGKLFPKEEGQSTVPILIEFPYDLYARSRNSYYKRLRTAIKILGLLALLILLSWMSVFVYINYAPKLTAAADTPLDTFQTVTSIPMTMKKLDKQKPVPELLSEEQSYEIDKGESEGKYSEHIDENSDESDTEDQTITTPQMSSSEAGVNVDSIEESAMVKDNESNNKPDIVKNKFWDQLEEVWKKLQKDAENKSDKNMTKELSDDDIKSENKQTADFTETQEKIKASVETSVTNASLESKSEEIDKDESSEENYSEYIYEDSDESDTEDQTVTTPQMPSSEAGVNTKSMEESAKVKDDVSINKPGMVQNKFWVRLEESWKKLQNDAENQNVKNVTKESANDDSKSENKHKTEFTETQEKFIQSVETSVTNASLESKSEEIDKDESLEENYSEYIYEDSDESDTEDQTVTTPQMSSSEAGVNNKSMEKSAEVKDDVSINKPGMVQNKFWERLEESWKKLQNDAENQNVKNVTNESANDDSKSENKHTTEFTETQEKFIPSVETSVTNASLESKSEEIDKDESSEENYSEYIYEDSDESDTEDQTVTTPQMPSSEAGVNTKSMEESAKVKDDVSINKPGMVQNKFWVLLEESWKKLQNDAENQNFKNVTNESANDDSKSENKHTTEFTEIDKDESLEENYSEYIYEDSDESGVI